MSSTLEYATLSRENIKIEWFTAIKELYSKAQETDLFFGDELILKRSKEDQLETVSSKKNLFGIFNDVLFNKGKSQYYARFAFSLKKLLYCHYLYYMREILTTNKNGESFF